MEEQARCATRAQAHVALAKRGDAQERPAEGAWERGEGGTELTGGTNGERVFNITLYDVTLCTDLASTLFS